jgi:uncharacterized protein YabN with tetrapyrrole methylase and pyrophosphatase domain
VHNPENSAATYWNCCNSENKSDLKYGENDMTEFEKYIKEAADRLNIEIEGIDLDEAQKLWNAALEAAALKCEEIGDSGIGKRYC